LVVAKIESSRLLF